MTTITPEMIARRVRLARKGGLVLALVLGLAFSLARLNAYQHAAQMLATGTVVDATIIQKRHWREEGKRDRENDRYSVTYEFVGPTGSTFSKERRVGHTYFSEVREGDTISIVYDASLPTVNDTKAQYERRGSLANSVRDSFVLVIIVIMVGYAIGFLVDKRMRKQMSAQAAVR